LRNSSKPFNPPSPRLRRVLLTFILAASCEVFGEGEYTPQPSLPEYSARSATKVVLNAGERTETERLTMQISKKYILPSQIGELPRQYGITTKEARRTRRVRMRQRTQQPQFAWLIFILLNFVTSFENLVGGGGLLPSDLRMLRKHYNTSSSFRHGLPEPRLTWMCPDASCGPGCRQSMPA
jgi:hypothetical protein